MLDPTKNRYPMSKGKKDEIHSHPSTDRLYSLQPKMEKLYKIKVVGGAKLSLESNPIPVRDVWRAETKLVHTRILGPHKR